MSFVCSDDPQHQSITDEFCSICGAPVQNDNIGGPSNQAVTMQGKFSSAAGRTAANGCPTCGIARIAGDVFCGNCGTEYATGSLVMPEPAMPNPPAVIGTAPSEVQEAVAAQSEPPSVPPQTVTNTRALGSPTIGSLRAVLCIDLTPRECREVDAVPPSDCSERIFILDNEILPFGRTSAWMPIPDSGASRRHGEFLRHADGYYGLRDVGSANGTLLNGSPLQGQEIRRVKAGDIVTVGFWHIIRIEE